MPAQAAPGDAPKVSAPPSTGERALKRGLEAYQAGRIARAIGAFSSAISAGGLKSDEIARALYYRGLAYRKQGKPAQAISDLTNAIWLKDGLSGNERNEAIAARAAAYKDAGLADPGGIPPAAVTAEPERPAATAAPRQAAAAPAQDEWTASKATREPNSSGGGIGGFFSGGGLFGSLFGGSKTSGNTATASSQAAAPAESAPAAAASEVTTSSTTTASTTASAPAPIPVVAAPPPAPPPQAPVTTAVSSWSTETEVNRRKATTPAKVRRTAAATPAPTVTPTAFPVASPPSGAPPSGPVTGNFKLQVGVLRSRTEANKLIADFMAKHGGEIGPRAPAIEETVFGNMGTFYRVNIGPYATADEPGRLCDSLRPGGFDCLVVTK